MTGLATKCGKGGMHRPHGVVVMARDHHRRKVQYRIMRIG